MDILGIETSCDETAAAVVRDGETVLSSVVFSQIPLHQRYGGVVPEIASRSHIEKIGTVVREAVEKSGTPWGGIDAVAVTYGPGLASSLIVGLSAAKGLAVSLGKPLICVNHIEAHLHTPFLIDAGESRKFDRESLYPMLGLAVSGGHTTFTDMPACGEYKIIGQTLDDAAGEAFDKASKLLGLGYPGGPVIDKLAKTAPGKVNVDFPKGRPRPRTLALGGLDPDLCVSFSGLKTSLLHYLQKNPPQSEEDKADIARCYQKAIVDSLCDRAANALKRRNCKALVLGGGVSLNSSLRSAMQSVAKRFGVELLAAKPAYCGDNAAMIAALAYFKNDISGDRAMLMDVQPSLEAGDVPYATA